MVSRKIILTIILSTILFLSACGESVDTQIYNHLEEAVHLERGFEEQQASINELEKKEQEIYNQIVELGMDDFEKIQELSSDAITVIDQRKEKIELEKNSIEESKVEFEKAQSLIEEIEDEEAKERAEKMYETMMNRYNSYDTLYEAYTASLTLEKELYELLQQEEMEEEVLTKHIDEINVSYQSVIEANEAFNSYTNEYNELKKAYYDKADITVTFEEDE